MTGVCRLKFPGAWREPIDGAGGGRVAEVGVRVPLHEAAVGHRPLVGSRGHEVHGCDEHRAVRREGVHERLQVVRVHRVLGLMGSISEPSRRRTGRRMRLRCPGSIPPRERSRHGRCRAVFRSRRRPGRPRLARVHRQPCSLEALPGEMGADLGFDDFGVPSSVADKLANKAHIRHSARTGSGPEVSRLASRTWLRTGLRTRTEQSAYSASVPPPGEPQSAVRMSGRSGCGPRQVSRTPAGQPGTWRVCSGNRWLIPGGFKG
jgi:hypothetical protein